jgi:cell division septum initiation protein DivIVA
MNENNDLLPNLLHEEFEMQMRGYSRRQVDDFVARRNNEIRELEQRLARALDEGEHLRRENAAVRQQALAGRPAHEEVSERIAQILKLADDEAKAQKNKAEDDIAKIRVEAQQEADRLRADAREQAERMLTAAQEQAERAITAARSEADKTRTAARNEADRLTGDTRKKADAALANAKAQAKKVLDEATARASAIHDGAERRLNLLSTRHQETVRRLTDILDGVQGLVAAETGRMSLEEEVNHTVSKTLSMAEAADAAEANGDLDLARLAPPAPETAAVGTAAPPRDVPDGRPAQPPRTPQPPSQQPVSQPPLSQPRQPGRHAPTASGGSAPSSAPGGSGSPAGAPATGTGRARGGGSGGPSMPDGSARPGTMSGSDSTPRAPIPMPSGSPRPGPAAPGTPPSGASRPSARDDKQEPGRGLIDPDEPTEGLRLMP